MRLLRLFFLFLLLPAFVWAQNGIITGKVINKETHNAIAGASVFLSNSSFGTTTATDGTFTLSNLRPGQYALVVNIMGYQEYIKTVLINADAIKLDIELAQKAIELREVVISSTSRADWNRNYEMFKKDFIGTDANAKECVVMNPKILDFTYHRAKQVLDASAGQFLIVVNKALGYRVKFLLNDFKSDKLEGTISYAGQRLFEELPGNEAQKKKWRLKRDIAYYGSPMHFYRALYTDKLKDEGFEIRRLTRVLDPERPPEAVIQKKIAQFSYLNRRDSLQYWYDIAGRSKFTKQKIAGVPWMTFEVLRTGPQPGLYAITFPDYLYVIYNKRMEETPFKDVYRPLDMPNYETSVVTLFNNPPYAFFDRNGIVVGDATPLYEGSWSKARLSELLPVDYTPSDKP